MICPYCNNDMNLGSIQTDNLLSWTPDGESPIGATRWAKSPNSIVLANYFMLVPAVIDAFYCPDCHKIIIDVNNTK